MGFFSNIRKAFSSAKYTATIEGQDVPVYDIKKMDSYDKHINRMTAKLHVIEGDEQKRYVVEFTQRKGDKKYYFDLPEQYAQLAMRTQETLG